MEQDNYQRLSRWIIAIVAIAYIAPIVLLGPNSYIRIHDTLEGEWQWLKLLADSHTAFNYHIDAIVPQVMKGQPRCVFPTGLSVNMILVQLIGAHYAYLLSSIIIHLVGFISMTLLLRTYIIKKPENAFIAWLCALSFSVLPVFIPFGISVMGQPLLIWAFLNLRAGRKLWPSYLIVVLFPFYTSVVWFAIPFAVLLVGLAIFFMRRSYVGKHYGFGLLLLAVMFAAVNFPMLNATFIAGGFIPHRVAYNLYMNGAPQISAALSDCMIMLGTTHYHVGTMVPAVCLVGILLMLRKSNPILIVIISLITGIIIFQCFYSFPEYWLNGSIGIVKAFRFNRFSILLPFLWILGFAIAVDKMRDSSVLKPLVLPLLLFQVAYCFIGNDEVVHNYRMLSGHQKFPAFQNYTAQQQFEDIKNYIGKPQSSYYVASFALSPSVAQHNGFYTLDGLMSLYDLRYKLAFRQVFAGEIEKSKEIKQYYDGWANRCYIFSSELGTGPEAYNNYKFKPREVQHLDFNAKAFAALGGRYLISAVEIKNHEQQGLHLEKIFKDPVSWWTIYLYSVNPDLKAQLNPPLPEIYEHPKFNKP